MTIVAHIFNPHHFQRQCIWLKGHHWKWPHTTQAQSHDHWSHQLKRRPFDAEQYSKLVGWRKWISIKKKKNSSRTGYGEITSTNCWITAERWLWHIQDPSYLKQNPLDNLIQFEKLVDSTVLIFLFYWNRNLISNAVHLRGQ